MFRIFIETFFRNRQGRRFVYKSYWNGESFGSIHFARQYDESSVGEVTCDAGEHLYTLRPDNQRRGARIQVESI